MKLGKLDWSVAIIAALTCVLMAIELPVWALFIGWAWYYALGSTPDLIRRCVPPMLMGSVLGYITFFLIDVFTKWGMPWLLPTIVSVFITVIVLMLSLKIELFNISLVSFNAFCCVFAGFGTGSYLKIDGIPVYLNAFLWITGAHFLGLLTGWISIAVTQPRKA
ncbi:MAG TPA: DUF1097 domain-containing protein [Clostridiaceae bacterium]|nr:DUF1097 domain-containing protein [Clostridiaceae bacterium]